MTPRTEARLSPRHGLGVYARTEIPAGEVIERCAVLVLDPDDSHTVGWGSLYGYAYDWGDGQLAIALGHGSLYNHDPHPNADYTHLDDPPGLEFVATRSIAAGEEITIDYTGGGEVELWFDLDQPVDSATTVPPVASTNACGEAGNTSVHVPAAAHTSS